MDEKKEKSTLMRLEHKVAEGNFDELLAEAKDGDVIVVYEGQDYGWHGHNHGIITVHDLKLWRNGHELLYEVKLPYEGAWIDFAVLPSGDWVLREFGNIWLLNGKQVIETQGKVSSWEVCNEGLLIADETNNTIVLWPFSGEPSRTVYEGRRFLKWAPYPNGDILTTEEAADSDDRIFRFNRDRIICKGTYIGWMPMAPDGLAMRIAEGTIVTADGRCVYDGVPVDGWHIHPRGVFFSQLIGSKHVIASTPQFRPQMFVERISFLVRDF